MKTRNTVSTGLFTPGYFIHMMIVWAIIALLIVGCTATWGRLKANAEAEKSFDAYRYLEGYTYYYLGFESEPEAIMALDAGYELAGSFWIPMDRNAHDLERMVGAMRFQACEHEGYDPYTFDKKRRLTGYTLLDPIDKPIGILFSCFDWFPVKFLSENRVSVYKPEQSRSSTYYYDW